MNILRKHMMTRGRKVPVAGCVLLLLMAGCGGEKQAPPPPGVTVTAVKEEKVPITMEFPGTVQSVKTVDIIPQVSGYIDKRYFEEGSHVKKGEPLYLIDPRPYKAKLDAADAQLELDLANLELQKSELKRYTNLARSGAGSEEQRETAVAKLKEAQASVDKDKADIEEARLNLGFTRITAPFPGRIQNTQVYEGALVESQRDKLTTLVQMNPIYVIFNLSRRDLFEIQLLQREGKIPRDWRKFTVAVMLPDGSEYEHRGHLNFISSQIDSNTDTLMMRAELSNPAEKSYETDLVPGQFVPVRLILGENPKALLIPKEALVESQAGSQVFVVGKDDKVEVCTVDVGHSYKQQWLIKKGLKKGARVVVKGTQKVHAGMVVSPEVGPQGKTPSKKAPPSKERRLPSKKGGEKPSKRPPK